MQERRGVNEKTTGKLGGSGRGGRKEGRKGKGQKEIIK